METVDRVLNLCREIAHQHDCILLQKNKTEYDKAVLTALERCYALLEHTRYVKEDMEYMQDCQCK